MSLIPEHTDLVTLDMYKALELRISEIEKKLEEMEVDEPYTDDEEDDLSFDIEPTSVPCVPKPPVNLVDRCIPSLMSGNVSAPVDVKFPLPITKQVIEKPEKKTRLCKKEPKEAKRLDGTTKTYISSDSANFWSAISLTYDKYKKAVPSKENRLPWNNFRGVFSKFWHAGSAVDKELWAKEGTNLDWSSLSP